MGRVPDRIARYEVERELGSGGMGTVYLARDPDLGRRRVAIKLIQAQLDSPELRERFAREALTVATLNHPHIVTVYDSGQHESRPYLVLEYIQGRPLARVIVQRETAPLGIRLRWLEELCDGLEFAHEAGVVHRDIKPANVMLDHLDRLKILDFGIARMTGAATMAMSGPIGTPGYMAPEYIRGESWDERIDIFAAGAVAYELLSYRPAFPGDTAATVMHRVMTSDPEPLDDPSSGLAVGADLEGVVRGALEKRPEDRYRTAGQFKDALHAARERLERGVTERTTPVERWGPDRDEADRRRTPDGRRTPRSTPGSGGAQPRPTPGTPNRSALEDAVRRRRDHLIRNALARAETELADGRLDDAMAACIEAATLDEGRAETIAMTARVQRAVDAREAEGLLGLAQQELERGALTAAHDLVENARALCSTPAGADVLEEEIARKRKEREVGRQLAQQFRSHMSEARESFAADDLPAALSSVQRALQLNPTSTQALDLQRTLQARIEERDRIEQENRRAREAAQRVAHTIAAGRSAMASGKLEIAETILREGIERDAVPELTALLGEVATARTRTLPRPEVTPVGDPTLVSRTDRSGRRSRLQAVGVPAAALLITLTAGVGWLLNSPTDPAPAVEVPPVPGGRLQETGDAVPFVSLAPVTPDPAVTRPPDPGPRSSEERPSPRPIQEGPVTPPAQPRPLLAPLPVPAPAPISAPSTAVVQAKSLIATGAFGEALLVLQREDPNNPEVAPLIGTARQGLHELAQKALAAAKSHESAGNWIGALEQYQRARQLDPSIAVDDSMARVRARMKEEATDALTRARQYDALDRIEDAVLWYDRAFRNMLDDDPARTFVKERLDALRPRK